MVWIIEIFSKKIWNNSGSIPIKTSDKFSSIRQGFEWGLSLSLLKNLDSVECCSTILHREINWWGLSSVLLITIFPLLWWKILEYLDILSFMSWWMRSLLSSGLDKMNSPTKPKESLLKLKSLLRRLNDLSRWGLEFKKRIKLFISFSVISIVLIRLLLSWFKRGLISLNSKLSRLNSLI